MKLKIKKTDKNTYYQTEFITREAFWNVYEPGCSEHLILHQLRKSKSYISELDLVALCESEIVGHIISTRAYVVDSHNGKHEILCVGPLAILPNFQNKGIGSLLINESIKTAAKLGFDGMILFGNPSFYHRFGFVNAQKYQITTKDFQNFEPFMALELFENSLGNVNGCFYEDESFSVDEKELEMFEKQFPYKEKQITDTQFKH